MRNTSAKGNFEFGNPSNNSGDKTEIPEKVRFPRPDEFGGRSLPSESREKSPAGLCAGFSTNISLPSELLFDPSFKTLKSKSV